MDTRRRYPKIYEGVPLVTDNYMLIGNLNPFLRCVGAKLPEVKGKSRK